jgi:hypothetical protein
MDGYRKFAGCDPLPQDRDDIAVFFLDADDSMLYVKLFCYGIEPVQDTIRIYGQQLLVYPQQRFTFSRIHDQVFRFTGNLSMCRESGTAGTDNPGAFNLFY